MGQTTVFTVSLDSDDVAIGDVVDIPPRRPVRDALQDLSHNRQWAAAFAIAFAIPAIAAGVAAVLGGAWVTTTFLVATALVTPASGAWAAAQQRTGDRDRHLAAAFVAGLAGACLALASLPGLVWASRVEGLGDAGAGPTLLVLALTSAAAAWLGSALGRHGIAAVAIVLGCAVLPLAAYGALLPSTNVTEPIEYLAFTPAYDLGRPTFVCTRQEVTVTRNHTELIAWLATLSPLVWAVDASEFMPSSLAGADDGTLAQAQAWTRSTRVGPDDFMGHCYAPTSLGVPAAVREARYEKVPSLALTAAAASAMLAAVAAGFTSWRRSSRSLS